MCSWKFQAWWNSEPLKFPNIQLVQNWTHKNTPNPRDNFYLTLCNNFTQVWLMTRGTLLQAGPVWISHGRLKPVRVHHFHGDGDYRTNILWYPEVDVQRILTSHFSSAKCVFGMQQFSGTGGVGGWEKRRLRAPKHLTHTKKLLFGLKTFCFCSGSLVGAVFGNQKSKFLRSFLWKVNLRRQHHVFSQWPPCSNHQ